MLYFKHWTSSVWALKAALWEISVHVSPPRVCQFKKINTL